MVKLTRKRIGLIVNLIGLVLMFWWAIANDNNPVPYVVGAVLVASGSAMRYS